MVIVYIFWTYILHIVTEICNFDFVGFFLFFLFLERLFDLLTGFFTDWDFIYSIVVFYNINVDRSVKKVHDFGELFALKYLIFVWIIDKIFLFESKSVISVLAFGGNTFFSDESINN